VKGDKIMGTTFKLEVLFNPTLLSYLAMKRALLMDFEEEFVKEAIVRYKGLATVRQSGSNQQCLAISFRC
jgi:hypothetical protein